MISRKRARELIVRLRRPYRIGISALAMCLLFASFALRATEAFTADAIEQAALGALISNPTPQTVNPVSGVKIGEEATSNSLYESEIFVPDEGESAGTQENEGSASPGDDGVMPIYKLDLSGSPAEGELLLRNTETSLSPDLDSLFEAPYPDTGGGEGPAVLILHTHGTECYSDSGGWYTSDTSFRTQDTERNMIAVGAVIAAELDRAGIETVHCTVMHDAEDYNSSYDLARASIEEYLAKYPSIRYIIDVHRDAIIRSDSSMVAPVTETPEGRAAQVMLVVGTNSLGADHPNWQNNLNIACKLQKQLNSEFVLARPINLRAASFNEQFRAGSMLLEIGSCGNTLEEAKLAGKLFARSFAAMLEKYGDRG